MVSDDAMIDIREAIGVFDRVGDNKLAVADIVNALRALGMNPGSDEWASTITDYQKKGVERIEVEEFAAIYDEESKKTRASYRELVEGLKALDPGNAEAGLLNAATLKRYLSALGDTVTDEEAERIVLPALDPKGNNVIINDVVKLVMTSASSG